MKRSFMTLSFLLFSLSLQAQNEEAELREGPCVKLMEACKLYIKTLPSDQKKRLYRDCMHPVLSGERIVGVNIADADIKACQTKKAELKQKK